MGSVRYDSKAQSVYLDYYVGTTRHRPTVGRIRNTAHPERDPMWRVAEKRLERIEAEIALGQHRSGDVRFGAFAERWITGVAGEIGERTALGYRQGIRLYFAPIWDRPLDSLTPSDIREVRQHIASGTAEGARGKPLRASTVNRHMTTLKMILNAAVEDDLIPKSPARTVGRLKPTDGEALEEIRIFTLDEMDAFVSADRPPWPARWALAFRLGLRPGELLGLRLGDFDFRACVLFVRRQLAYVPGTPVVECPPKHNSKRQLPLSQTMIDLALSIPVGDTHDYLYGRSGEPMGPKALERAFTHTLVLAGLSNHTPHDLRHTCLTYLLASGASLKDVQTWAGHKSLGPTEVYLHLLPSAFAAVPAKQDAFLGSHGAVRKPDGGMTVQPLSHSGSRSTG